MPAAMKVVPKEIKVSDIAAAAIEKANGDTIKAAAIMEREVLANEAKYRALMDPLLATACYSAVSMVHRQNNAKIWTAPNYTAGGNGSRVHALSAGNMLMAFALPGGKPLGEATKTEVAEAADFYDKQASDMSVKAQWLLKISDKLTGKKTVATVFTEETLRQLQAEVQNA